MNREKDVDGVIIIISWIVSGNGVPNFLAFE